MLCLLSLALFFSCAKSSFESPAEAFVAGGKSEFLISVNYISWTGGACADGCGAEAKEMVTPIPDASVDLYLGQVSMNDVAGSPVLALRTDQQGNVLMESLVPDRYTIVVHTLLGTLSRTIEAEAGVRKRVDFNY